METRRARRGGENDEGERQPLAARDHFQYKTYSDASPSEHDPLEKREEDPMQHTRAADDGKSDRSAGGELHDSFGTFVEEWIDRFQDWFTSVSLRNADRTIVFPDRPRDLKQREVTLIDRMELLKKVFDEEQESFEDVLFESRMIDEALTPLSWILFFDAIYTLVLLFVSMRETFQVAEQQTLTPFQLYEALYFPVVNSTALPSFLVSSWVACVLQRRPIYTDKYFLLAALLALPPFLTHCAIGCFLGAPIILPLLAFAFFFEHQTRHRYRTRNAKSLILRGTARLVLNFTIAFVMGASFNYSVLMVYEPGLNGNPTYWPSVIAAEWRARSIVCTLDSYGENLANVLQSLGSIGTLF